MKKIIVLFAIFFFSLNIINAQKDTVKQVKTKKGWKLGGVVPAIAYDSDIGFKYGGLINFFDYGDGTVYPNYLKSLYMEWTRTTKGSGINEILYDDRKFLGKNLRFTFDINYLTEQNLDFFGFNGYQAKYHWEWEDENDPAYKSRMYYNHERKMLKITTDFQGQITDKKLRWIAGFGFYGVKIASVDIEKLNKGKADDEKLPTVTDMPGLYENYIAWGIIKDDQKSGGNVKLLKAGVVYDTRDNEACPMNGVWSEILFVTSPGFLGNDYGYTQMVLTHRQYFTLVPVRLSAVYRLSYSQKLGGEIPFYMLPFYYNSMQNQNGFGGAKTIRGIMRNRVVGDAVVFGNIELRWKFLMTRVFNQELYLALSSFLDAGRITQRYQYPQNNTAPNVWEGKEAWHYGYGGGFRIALNNNFIIAVDYGMAAKKDDGKSGLYINLGWLF